jgi:hypothetical protein
MPEVVKAILARGKSIEEIIDFTGLSKAEIEINEVLLYDLV